MREGFMSKVGALIAGHDTTISEEERLQCLHVLRRHKVPLAFLDVVRLWASSSHSAGKIYEEEIAEYKLLKEEFAQCLSALKEKGIETLFIKSSGEFPYRSDNLDILIKVEEMDEARKLLEEMGYTENRRYVEPGKFLYRKLTSTHPQPILHLHENVSWGYTIFLSGEWLWQRAQRGEDGALYPCREDSFLVNLAHGFYENYGYTLYDLWKFYRLLSEEDFDWERVFEGAKTFGWLDGASCGLEVVDQLMEGLFGRTFIPQERIRSFTKFTRAFINRACDKMLGNGNVAELGKPLSKTYFYKKLLRENNPFTKKCYKLFITTLNNIRGAFGWYPQKGFLISISGVDGCGKTSLAKGIYENLKLCDLRVRYVWSRAGFMSIARVIKFFFPAKSKNSGIDEEVKERLSTKKIVEVLWSYIVALDILLYLLLKVCIPLRLGYVVVCDRYIWDALVDLTMRFGQRDVLRGPGKGVLMRLAAKPNIAYYLKVNADIVRDRKKHDVYWEGLDARIRMYDDMAGRCNLSIVDASKPLSELVEKLSRDSADKYFSLYERRKPGWRG